MVLVVALLCLNSPETQKRRFLAALVSHCLRKSGVLL